jgi:ferredoxin
MSKYQIKQDVEKCIGCGTCVSMCVDNWEMKDDGKAHPIKKELEDIGCNQDAADSCPVQCIIIEEI